MRSYGQARKSAVETAHRHKPSAATKSDTISRGICSPVGTVGLPKGGLKIEVVCFPPKGEPLGLSLPWGSQKVGFRAPLKEAVLQNTSPAQSKMSRPSQNPSHLHGTTKKVEI